MTCTIPGCGATSHAQGLCPKHYTRLRRRGHPLAVSDLRGRPLDGEPTWVTIHKRLSRERGPAKNMPCVDCGDRAAEWSYDGTDPEEKVSVVRGVRLRFSLDLSRYVPRCVPCHRHFDQRPGVRVLGGVSRG